MNALRIMMLFLAITVAMGCANGNTSENNSSNATVEKVDDWQYDQAVFDDDEIMPFATQNSVRMAPAPMGAPAPMMESMAAPMDKSIGFSAGGAKDVGNFRENIENGYLPLPTDITHVGLFYDYFFDTGQLQECKKLFCPSYAMAMSPDPFSGKKEYYLSVGLNSGMTEADFKRKKLNLVVVLDISGSMGSPFDSYYYDQFGNEREIELTEEDHSSTKMQLAAKAVTQLMDHLEDGDRFGIVLYDDGAYLAKPLTLVGRTDMKAIKGHLLELGEQGGTNMSAGMDLGTSLYKEFENSDPRIYENRIIFLTDAMPNQGETSEDGLVGMIRSNAKRNIYTTFIGIGVDLNTELVEAITKARGANYYSVHSSKEFKTRMDDEFEFMVTPLVFDLALTVDAQGFEIEKVYGSPEADEATGEIMRVSTLFPSRTEEGETRGGLILLKLKKNSDDAKIVLKASYEDRTGAKDGDEAVIKFDSAKGAFYDNNGIRKGIVLSRYANLIQDWAAMERLVAQGQEKTTTIQTRYDEDGIPVYSPVELGEWERTSMDLQVSPVFKPLFSVFKGYMDKEIEILGDKSMTQETVILEKLASQ